MTLVYIYRKIYTIKGKKPNEHMSYSLTKKRPAKKIKKIIFGKKIFFGPLLLLKEFRADFHMGEKGGVTKRGEIFLQNCFLPHTPSVLCCWNKTTKTSNNSSSNSSSNSNNSHNRGGQIM